MSRRERLKALDLDRVLIIVDRGNVELALPRGWTVAPDPEGHLTCKDPTDSCKLEVSYFALPGWLVASAFAFAGPFVVSSSQTRLRARRSSLSQVRGPTAARGRVHRR